MTTFAARFHDGRAARTAHVTCTIAADTLELRDRDGAIVGVWRLADVHLADRPRRGEPLRLRHRDGGPARLTIDDAAVLRPLEAACANLRRLLPGWRRQWRQIVLWGIAAAASLALLVLVILPWGASVVARAIPPATEVRIGAAAAEQVARTLATLSGRDAAPFCERPAGRAALDLLAGRLSDTLALPYALTVHVVDIPIVNAFALPGGHVLLLRGLIEKAPNAESVTGVLAHEIGHVLHRHPMELFTRNAGIAALIGLVLGDVTGGVVITALAQRLLTASYTREFERAADTTAVELLNAHDIDGRPLVDFFVRLHAEHGVIEDLLGPFATHPLSAERAATISDRVTGSGPALTPAQWAALRGVCD